MADNPSVEFEEASSDDRKKMTESDFVRWLLKKTENLSNFTESRGL